MTPARPRPLSLALVCERPEELVTAIQATVMRLSAGRSGEVRSLLEAPALLTGSAAERLTGLAELTRLLVRQGGRQPLRQALTLSHRLHELERARRAKGRCALLLRGLVRLGLGDQEAGALDLLRAMADRHLEGSDRVLAAWGLVSVALSTREIGASLTAARRWLAEAGEAGAHAEACRATQVVGLLHWLEGAGPAPAEPVPDLLLGHPLAAAPAEGWAPGPERPPLTWLHRARLALERGEAARLPAGVLAAVASRTAAWEASGTTLAMEELLRLKSPGAWHDHRAEKLLGRAAWQASAVTRPEALAPLRRQEAIVLMSDVRGYSTLSEARPPEVLFPLLGPVFKILHEELEQAGGMIQEFVGDAVMVVFNAFGEANPSSTGAVLTATGRALARVLARARLAGAQGEPQLRIGVGLEQGRAASGLLGSLARWHLATLGHTVNTAARLESLSKELPAMAVVGRTLLGRGGPEAWTRPDDVTYTLRDCGHHRLKGISEPAPVHGLSPLLRHAVDFVPPGYVGHAEPGVVYLDVGNAACPGVLDNHAPGSASPSTVALVMDRPALLLRHARGLDPLDLVFRLHEAPDLDCAAAYVACVELLEAERLRRGASPEVRRVLRRRAASLRRLARYVSLTDQGAVPNPARLADSLQGVFAAHLDRLEGAGRSSGHPLTDRQRLAAGVRVVDAALYLADRAGRRADFSTVFEAEPGWFPEERRLLRDDRALYLSDRARGETFLARVAGAERPVAALWLAHPASLMFKLWARTDPEAPTGRGFSLLVVDWSRGEEARFVASVAPDSGTHLDGLGQALEAAETEKRRRIGKVRPIEPRRWPADNSNPWYFGQGHDYTIVDSPSGGTALTRDEVQTIIKDWLPPGPRSPPRRHGRRGRPAQRVALTTPCG